MLLEAEWVRRTDKHFSCCNSHMKSRRCFIQRCASNTLLQATVSFDATDEGYLAKVLVPDGTQVRCHMIALSFTDRCRDLAGSRSYRTR